MRTLSGLVSVVLLTAVASAQPIPEGVGPYYISPLTAPDWEWKEHTDGWRYLSDGKACRGAFKAGVWLPCDGKTWGKACPAPWEAKKQPTVRNFGVDVDKLACKDGEPCPAPTYKINGHDVDRKTAMKAIVGADVPDDTEKLRLTVIGSEAERKKVLADLDSSPQLVGVKERVLIQAYPPDHWAVTGAGFSAGGKPTIYVQAPSGKVLHRQDDYADGASGLATAIRKADPNYDPKKDPDTRKPTVIPADLQGYVPYLLLAAGGGLGLWMLRKGGISIPSVMPKPKAQKAASPPLTDAPIVHPLVALLTPHIEAQKAAEQRTRDFQAANEQMVSVLSTLVGGKVADPAKSVVEPAKSEPPK